MVGLQGDEGDYQPWLFDPIGLLLVGVVGSVGILSLIRHSWVLGIPCVTLATLRLIAAHRHFKQD